MFTNLSGVEATELALSFLVTVIVMSVFAFIIGGNFWDLFQSWRRKDDD